jgi:hypothetical protein
MLDVATAPGHHRSLGAAHDRRDLLAGHPLRGQQHNPGALDLPGRRPLATSTSLQLPPIGLGNLHHPHMRGHEKWSPWPRDHIKNYRYGALALRHVREQSWPFRHLQSRYLLDLYLDVCIAA